MGDIGESRETYGRHEVLWRGDTTPERFTPGWSSGGSGESEYTKRVIVLVLRLKKVQGLNAG